MLRSRKQIMLPRPSSSAMLPDRKEQPKFRVEMVVTSQPHHMTGNQQDHEDGRSYRQYKQYHSGGPSPGGLSSNVSPSRQGKGIAAFAPSTASAFSPPTNTSPVCVVSVMTSSDSAAASDELSCSSPSSELNPHSVAFQPKASSLLSTPATSRPLSSSSPPSYDDYRYHHENGGGVCIRSCWQPKPRPPPQSTPGRQQQRQQRIKQPTRGKTAVLSTSSPPPSAPAAAQPPNRKKFKTELCAHHASGRCPFGVRCSYAHGAHELELTGLLELHRAGLADKDTYRTRPCFAHVSTGACPFGQRCLDVHDPRACGPATSPAWLPHCEMPSRSNLSTTVHVNRVHHLILQDMYHGNPLVLGCDLVNPSDSDAVTVCKEEDVLAPASSANEESLDWTGVYRRVCNVDTQKGDHHRRSTSPSSPLLNVSECHRLEIALLMRGDAGEQCHYVYEPNHVVYDELCMVLQTRAFRLRLPAPVEKGAEGTTVQEVTLEEFHTYSRQHRGTTTIGGGCGGTAGATTYTLAHEIAFGPAGKSSNPVYQRRGIWFNIDPREVVPCTPQAAKRRMVKQRKISAASINREASAAARFDAHSRFYPIRPLDRDAFRLVTAAMVHRLRTLKVRGGAPPPKDDGEASFVTASLAAEELTLKASFVAQKGHWDAWRWPVNLGRNHVDETTCVPSVDEEYRFATDEEGGGVGDSCSNVEGKCESSKNPSQKQSSGSKEASCTDQRPARLLWSSFVEGLDVVGEGGHSHPEHHRINPTRDGRRCGAGRLSVLRSLSNGASVPRNDDSEQLPLIDRKKVTNKSHGRRDYNTSFATGNNDWTSILLLDRLDKKTTGEWDMVTEYYRLYANRHQQKN